MKIKKKHSAVVKNILVAVDGTDFSDEVVRFASRIAKEDKAKLFMIYVFEVPRAISIDADIPEETQKGEKMLNHAADIAESYGLDADMDIIQSRSVGQGIIDEGRDLKVDLIVMGLNNKPRFGDTILGETISFVLKNAKKQVLILKEEVK